MYSCAERPFRSFKVNLLILRLWNLYILTNYFFKSSSNFFLKFLLQNKHLHAIKSTLTFLYSRQHSQSFYLLPHSLRFMLLCPYLHLILWTPSARLSRTFDSKFVKNLALSINFILLDMVLLLISFTFLPIF